MWCQGPGCFDPHKNFPAFLPLPWKAIWSNSSCLVHLPARDPEQWSLRLNWEGWGWRSCQVFPAPSLGTHHCSLSNPQPMFQFPSMPHLHSPCLYLLLYYGTLHSSTQTGGDQVCVCGIGGQIEGLASSYHRLVALGLHTVSASHCGFKRSGEKPLESHSNTLHLQLHR